MSENHGSEDIHSTVATALLDEQEETPEEKEKAQGEEIELSDMSKQLRFANIQRGLLTSSEEEEDRSEGHAHSTSSASASSYRELKIEYRAYPWRWLMLLVLCLINVSNGTMWLTFAPIPDRTAVYYNVSVNAVDWFSITYFIVSLVIGLFSIFVLDKYGLKVSLYLGAMFNLSGAVLRYLSTLDPVVCSNVFDKSGFMVAIIGQFLTACAQPFLLYAPTLLAAVWFPPNQRAICTNFASVANPIGIAIAQLVSPYVVSSSNRLPTLLWIYAIPAGITAAATIVAYWWKEPPVPPALSKPRELTFLRGVWKTVTNWNFWVLMAVWGGGAGLFNALLTLLPQILCPYGYSDEDSGLWGALMVFCGLIGATIAGLVIDFTKLFKEVAVVALGFALLCFVWFFEVSRLHDQAINIAFSLCLFGFFALPLIPACMELGVEVTYPVAESTSSGLLWSIAQIVGIVMVVIGQVLQVDVSADLLPDSRCGTDSGSTNSSGPNCFRNSNTSVIVDDDAHPQDLTNAMYFYLALIVLLFAFFVMVFKPQYRRVEAERKADLEASMFVPGPTSRDRYRPLHKREDEDDNETLSDDKEADKT